MFGTNSTENLYLSVSANQLGSGLYEQLTGFIGEHKDTALIIIDILQKSENAAVINIAMPVIMRLSIA